MARKPAAEAQAAAGPSLTVDRATFAAAVASVFKVVSKRVTIPVLTHMRVVADQTGRLIITGTDLDIEMRAEVPADVGGAFAITMPANVLHDIVRKLQAERVAISIDPARMASVISAGRSRFTLPGYPLSDFPNLEQPEGYSHTSEIPGSILADMIAKTSFAISTEETRYYLGGIYCHVVMTDLGPRLRFVATDGHRLARLETSSATGLDPLMPGVIIPRKAVEVMEQVAKEAAEAPVKIEFSTRTIRFSHGGVTVTSKLIDGTFPDYQRVIPQNNERRMIAPTLELSKAIDRVGSVSDEKGHKVKLSLTEGRLVVSLRNLDGAEATDEVEVEFSDKPLQIGFNSKYFAQILPLTGGDTVLLRFGPDDNSPVLMFPRGEGDSALWVLMPMRI